MSSTTIAEDFLEEFYPSRWKGTRRWLGKPWDGHQDDLTKQMKTPQFVQKTLQNDGIALSKKEIARLAGNDELQFNVVYTMNKKNRWEQADPVNMMKGVSAKADVAVVERNFVSFFENEDKDESTAFAVHSRTDYDVDDEDKRSPTLPPEARELSEKKDKKKPKKEEKMAEKPTVVYNIVRTHPVKEIATAGLSNAKSGSKAKGRTRGRPANIKNIQDYVGNDEDYSDEEDVEDSEYAYNHNSNVNFSDYLIEKERIAERMNSMQSFDLCDDFEAASSSCYEEIDDGLPELLDINDVLAEKHLFTMKDFVNKDVKKYDFDEEVEKLRENTDLIVRTVGNKCVFVNASPMLLPKPYYTFLMVFRVVESKFLSIQVDSTVKCKDMHVATVRDCIDSNKSFIEIVLAVAKFLKSLPLDEPKLEKDIFGEKVPELPTGLEAQSHSSRFYVPANAQDLKGMDSFIHSTCLYISDETAQSSVDTQNKNCTHCLSRYWKHLFALKNGTFECLICLRHKIYRQIRQQLFPVTVNLLLNEGDSELDALAMILPITVFNFYAKKLFENLYIGFGATGKFLECPCCSAQLYLEDDGPKENYRISVKCSACNSVWCRNCHGETHWPMNCEEFSEWKPKWEVQYIIQNPDMRPNMYMLDIECDDCKTKFDIIMPTRLASCPGCSKVVEEKANGISEGNTRELYNPIAAKYDFHVIYRVLTPERMKRKCGSKVKKNVADICTELRKLRMDEKFRYDMLKRMSHLRKVDPKIDELPELCPTILSLAENLLGLLYVSKKNTLEVTNLASRALKILDHFSASCEIEIIPAQQLRELRKISSALFSIAESTRNDV
ncbi:unnamed protein product [Caenorhabditis auriculariae]|uniref:IBR domain-containing protein n=1 Tax=Caenorhabditis auriculariae TaxID=2777116 RepID=A0A8S1H8Z9_9PELO|nr:unnamed protein product [Caenorhabditis auriculariae]